jgi:PAS domain S-box-containing protein
MLVETMNDGLGVQDEHGMWIYVNDRFCEMLGYPRDEMIRRPVTDFLSETDQILYREQVARRRRGELESYELSWLKKDGQTIFTWVSPKAILDEQGQYKGSFAVLTSITERKQAEEALKESEKQLRSLSSQLLTAEETERKRISRELHDELGQSLTVMKLRLNFIEKNLLKHQTELMQECEYGIQYIDQVIENIRRLSRDLSPTILEDFGLSAALRWLINNFAKSYVIKVNLNMIDVDSLLPRDSHVVVYRTVQEALTNIGKHSRGKNVSITIHEDGDMALFSIADDGIGFDERVAAARSPEEKGLGLVTMKGRVQMVGGVLNMWTEEGKGTRITLSIPIKRGATS